MTKQNNQTSQAPVVEHQTEQPATNHNRGPIGPLDPNEPPPYDPEMRRHEIVDAHYAVLLLRSMGVEISEKDLEYRNASGEGPSYIEAPGQKSYVWGDILDWTLRTPPLPLLNRKQATEYICSLGYPIGPTVLSQLFSKGPRFVRRGRDAYYAPEDCKEWVEEMKTLGPRHSTVPKHKPLNAKRRCPSFYKDCPLRPHEECANYPRALCHFTQLPDRR